MIEIRAARPSDAPELVRLRRLMLGAMSGQDAPGAWEADAVEMARAQLSVPRPRLGAFVVDGAAEDGRARLAACAVGSVEERLPAPRRPTGLFGFVFNVCTDPLYRGRGYARATTGALLDWFAEQGVSRVDLHASEEAEPLYRSLGFHEHSIALSLDISQRGR
ncbi:GNAT family N-acetyltransferase [Streptomyces sp. NPDC050610]|uniref:GNAT family N-acetyltransferase n=1 Tax=Streptomyces sp. NPDC050610 TaxID=3157097 RepID=UPI0034190E9F